MGSIPVETQDISTTAPVQLEFVNHSGANVEVFIFVGDLPAVHHAFDFRQSTLAIPLPGLAPGTHTADVFVRALKNLNRMYSLIVSVNNEIAAVADGNIPDDDTQDSGAGQFKLTV